MLTAPTVADIKLKLKDLLLGILFAIMIQPQPWRRLAGFISERNSGTARRPYAIVGVHQIAKPAVDSGKALIFPLLNHFGKPASSDYRWPVDCWFAGCLSRHSLTGLYFVHE